jgi:hypothetical protein
MPTAHHSKRLAHILREEGLLRSASVDLTRVPTFVEYDHRAMAATKIRAAFPDLVDGRKKIVDFESVRGRRSEDGAVALVVNGTPIAVSYYDLESSWSYDQAVKLMKSILSALNR